MSTVEIKVPDIGDFTGVPVIDVLVKVGDTVEVDTPLITLETEKATMDVPSTTAGKITALKTAKGGKVSQGDVIAVVEAQDAAAAAKPAPAEAPKPAKSETTDATVRQPALRPEPKSEPPPKVPSPPSGGEGQGEEKPRPAPSLRSSSPQPSPPVGGEGARTAYAGPSVRKLARELGVDLSRVTGSGLKGRITHDDVKAFVKKVLTSSAVPKTAPAAASGAALPKIPAVDFSKFGPIEIKPLSRIQKISGPRLHASWVNLPHVTQFDQADITDLEDTRNQLKEKAAKEGIKLTPLAFIIRACVKALKEYPQFNTSLDETGANLIQKKYLNIGFAADTPNGLMVPVIHDADKKDVYEIARDLAALSAKARDGKLNGAEMSGGCFTISSLGGIGGTAFTPIINAPEVAILGVSRSDHKPVYKDGGFVPRLMLPLSLSYDHRVVDGALAVRFTTFLAQKLADPRGLLEAVP